MYSKTDAASDLVRVQGERRSGPDFGELFRPPERRELIRRYEHNYADYTTHLKYITCQKGKRYLLIAQSTENVRLSADCDAPHIYRPVKH